MTTLNKRFANIQEISADELDLVSGGRESSPLGPLYSDVTTTTTTYNGDGSTTVVVTVEKNVQDGWIFD